MPSRKNANQTFQNSHVGRKPTEIERLDERTSSRFHLDYGNERGGEILISLVGVH